MEPITITIQEWQFAILAGLLFLNAGVKILIWLKDH